MILKIHTSSETLRAALERLLPPGATFTADETAADVIWTQPLPRRRLGAWVDDVLARMSQAASLPTTPIPLGPGLLDPRTRIYSGVMPPATLTAREVELLWALTQAPGRTLDKDHILQNIWGYRSDLETHTLETHIYRLRQKIEGDPRAPKILLTVPNGYALASP